MQWHRNNSKLSASKANYCTGGNRKVLAIGSGEDRGKEAPAGERRGWQNSGGLQKTKWLVSAFIFLPFLFKIKKTKLILILMTRRKKPQKLFGNYSYHCVWIGRWLVKEMCPGWSYAMWLTTSCNDVSHQKEKLE